MRSKFCGSGLKVLNRERGSNTIMAVFSPEKRALHRLWGRAGGILLFIHSLWKNKY
jgi:hypothetical protein